MDLFRKKDKPVKEVKDRVLEFNLEKLNTELQNLSDKLYDFRASPELAVVKEVIEMARNIHVLQVNHIGDEKQMLIHKGGLKSLNHLIHYIDASIANRVAEKKEGKPRDVRNTLKFRRIDNQAGSSI